MSALMKIKGKTTVRKYKKKSQMGFETKNSEFFKLKHMVSTIKTNGPGYKSSSKTENQKEPNFCFTRKYV